MQHSCGIKNISLHGLREAVAWEIIRDEQFSPRLRGIALLIAVVAWLHCRKAQEVWFCELKKLRLLIEALRGHSSGTS